jgi:hypothetical protein
MTSKRQFIGSYYISRGLKTFYQQGIIQASLVAEEFLTIEDEVERGASLWIITRINPLYDNHIKRLLASTYQALHEERIHIDFRPIINELITKIVDALESFGHAIQASGPLLAAIAEERRRVPCDFLQERTFTDTEVSQMILPWNDGLDMLPRSIAGDQAQDSLFATLIATPLRYSYSSLPTDFSIRIVTISTDLESENIGTAILELTTHIVDLCDHPEYTALSYTRGKSLTVFPTSQERDRLRLDSRYVLCDGSLLEVGENLYRYLYGWRNSLWHFGNDRLDPSSDLYSVRRKVAPQTHWIDALCINQSNTAERNQQVAIMGRIYRQSERVLIWLGPQDNYSESFHRMMLTVADSSPDNPEVAAKMERPWQVLNFEERVKVLGLPRPESWDWVCFWAVLNSPGSDETGSYRSLHSRLKPLSFMETI